MTPLWMMHFPDRYQQEIAAIRQAFPQARVFKVRAENLFCLSCPKPGLTEHLAVVATLVSHRGRRYPVLMVYPCTFPEQLPGIWPIRPLAPAAPRQYANRRLFLGRNEQDAHLTGLQILSLARNWLDGYEAWLQTKPTGHQSRT